LDTFKAVEEAASETSTLGSGLLGMNQGIPSSKEDLDKKIKTIEKAISTREKKFFISAKTLYNITGEGD
jgi:hypothetical protein